MTDIAEIMAEGAVRSVRWSDFWSRDDARELMQAGIDELSKAGYVVVKREQPNPEVVARRYAREMSYRIGAAVTGDG